MFDTSKIGQSFPPFTMTVERGKIHELTQAIGDENPVYHSHEAAIASGYADVPIFPTMPTVFTFWGNQQKMEQMTSLGIDVQRVLHGGEAYEYVAPIFAGDTLTGVMTLTEARISQSPAMSVYTFVTRYMNQHNQLVLNTREVVFVRS